MPDDIAGHLKQTYLNEVPFVVVSDIICFCLINTKENTDRVMLPVGNFYAYYGITYFSHKWICRI